MADWEWTYNGLTFGGDNDPLFDVAAVDGLMSMPDVNSSSVKRAGADGNEIGPQFADKRVGVFEIEHGKGDSTDSTLVAAYDQLMAAFKPRSADSVLTFGMPGHATRRLMCRPTKVDAPMSWEWVSGYAKFSVELSAMDQVHWMSDAEHQAFATPESPATGRVYPLLYPRTYGALGAGGVFDVFNDGNMEATWKAIIYGPCENPKLTLYGGSSSPYVELAPLSLAAGDFVVLDSRRQTILLNGSASRYQVFAPGSTWFDLPSGDSDLKFSCASSSAGVSASLTWRDTWI